MTNGRASRRESRWGLAALALAAVPLLMTLIFFLVYRPLRIRENAGAGAWLGWTLLGVIVINPCALVLASVGLARTSRAHRASHVTIVLVALHLLFWWCHD